MSYKKDKLQFNWVGMNAVEDDKDIGSMAFSPVLKNHNAHLIRNETLVCPLGEKWRGKERQIIIFIALFFSFWCI